MGLFSIMGRLGLDTSDFQAGVKRAESASTGMARKVASDVKGMIAGAFTLGAITSFTKSVINAGDRIGDLAEQYHLTNEEVQRLEILAGRTGVKFEKFGEAFIKFAELRQKAIDGDAKSLALINRYGVSQNDVANRSKTNLQLVTQISDAYSEVSGSSQAQADALDIAGAKGQKVLSTLTQIKNLGPVKLISDADIEALGQFNDALDEVKRQAQVAAAPALGFWGQVLKRGNELSASGANLSFQTAFFEELMGWNPNTSLTGNEKTGAITPQDIAAAREAMTPYVPGNVPGSDSAASTRATARSRFDRPDTGNLARIGGLYFGADYNLRLMTLQQETKRLTERIAVSNEAIAESVKE
jgi:hypothetical protein